MASKTSANNQSNSVHTPGDVSETAKRTTEDDDVGIEFYGCAPTGDNIFNGKFFAATFTDCVIKDATFLDCEFIDVHFIDCMFMGVMCANVHLREMTFTGCTFWDSKWENGELTGRCIEDMDMKNEPNIGECICEELINPKYSKVQEAAPTAHDKDA